MNFPLTIIGYRLTLLINRNWTGAKPILAIFRIATARDEPIADIMAIGQGSRSADVR